MPGSRSWVLDWCNQELSHSLLGKKTPEEAHRANVVSVCVCGGGGGGGEGGRARKAETPLKTGKRDQTKVVTPAFQKLPCQLNHELS